MSGAPPGAVAGEGGERKEEVPLLPADRHNAEVMPVLWKLIGLEEPAVDHSEMEEMRHHTDKLRRGESNGDMSTEPPGNLRRVQRPSPGPEALASSGGVLEKRSPWWTEGWRKRSYLLWDKKFLYFNSGRGDRPLGVLDFGLVRYELHCRWLSQEVDEGSGRSCDVCSLPTPKGWREFYLRPVAYPLKVFAFRGPKNEIGPLIQRLSSLVATRIDRPSPIERAVVSMQNFWRYPFINAADFYQQVESGDILLFRGTDRAARLQRTATRALYDHVGLMLRGDDGRVYLLEATGTQGVNTLSWDTFLAKRWDKCYNWVAYRKAYFPRTEEQMNALEDYVHSVLGHRYGLSVGKLLGRTFSGTFDQAGHEVSPAASNAHAEEAGTLKSSTSTAVEEDATRTFFCSELVAACLKRCGVLAGDRSSTTYWPGSFGQMCSTKLPLQDNVFLGEEQVIMFDP